MITITAPKGKVKVAKPFTLKLKFDFVPDGDVIAIYSSAYKSHQESHQPSGSCEQVEKSTSKATLLREVPHSESVYVDFLPQGCHQLFVSALKNGKMIRSNNIIVLNTAKTPAPKLTEKIVAPTAELCPCGSGKKLGGCGCGGSGGSHKKSSSSEEESSDHKCDRCHRPLKDCGCGRQSSSEKEEESSSLRPPKIPQRCDRCHRNLGDCGCGGHKKKKPPTLKAVSCEMCGGLLGDCGCGKKKKPRHTPPAEKATDEEHDSSEEDEEYFEDNGETAAPVAADIQQESQILIVHRSASIHERVGEVVVARDSEDGTALRLPHGSVAHRPVKIYNYGDRQISILPADGSDKGAKIETVDGQWKSVNLEGKSSVTLIPAGPQLWYLWVHHNVDDGSNSDSDQ